MIDHKIRSKGLGGTDIAAICGVHPYRTALDVYLDKRGLAEPVAENEAMKWGTTLEPVIAAEYAEREDVVLEECGTLIHPDRDWHVGTPDRLVVGQPVGLEIKTAGVRSAHRWGEQDTDEVPDEYLIQSAWYLALTNRERWDLAALIGGQEYRVYRIERSAGLEAALLEQGEAFWRDNVLAGEPPAPGPRDVASLALLYRQQTHDIIEPEPEHLGMAAEYACTLKHIAELKARRDAIRARLCADIGERKGLRGIATWSGTKGRATFDHKAALAAGALDAETIARFTKQSNPIRRFLFTYRGD